MIFMNDSYSNQVISSTYHLSKPVHLSVWFLTVLHYDLAFHFQMEGGPIGLDGDIVRDPADLEYKPEGERAPTRRPAMEGQNAQDPLNNIRTAYCRGAQVNDVLDGLGILRSGVYRRRLGLL